MKHLHGVLGAGIIAGLLSIGTALAGCVSDHNARPTLGSNITLDSLEGGGTDGDPPSLRGLDRSNWGATSIRVPVDGTVHRPTYARTHLYDDSLARQKGLYPTSETALELDGSRWMGAAEIAAQPFHLIVDAGMLPLRVAMAPPWTRTQSPRAVYKRRPPGGWLTGGAPVEVEAEAAPDAAGEPDSRGEVRQVEPDA